MFPLLAWLINAATMKVFGIWAPVSLTLVVPASLAYPYNTKSQSSTVESPAAIPQRNQSLLGDGYPVYPTACFPPPSPGRFVKPSDLPNILTDCSWIINEDLLQQYDLLFEDLIFRYKDFKDPSGKRYLSRWQRGQCVINVVCGTQQQTEKLQLFNVVLAAQKILRECMEAKHIPEGGTIPIGSPDKSFYVTVTGLHYVDSLDESNRSLSPNLDSFGWDVQRRPLRTISNTKPSTEDFDANESILSPPNDGMEKRSSNSQHSPLLLTTTQSLKPGSARNTSNLNMPLVNLSQSIQAPPDRIVDCFNPYSVQLKPAGEEDCDIVINEIILRYPNPMSPQTFGYGPSFDIDLSLPENEKWDFGCCVIFVRNVNKTRTDTFRMVDVAVAAHEIVRKCVVGARYPVGGTTDVGPVDLNFFVGVGGIIQTETTDFSRVDLVDDRIA